MFFMLGMMSAINSTRDLQFAFQSEEIKNIWSMVRLRSLLEMDTSRLIRGTSSSQAIPVLFICVDQFILSQV